MGIVAKIATALIAIFLAVSCDVDEIAMNTGIQWNVSEKDNTIDDYSLERWQFYDLDEDGVYPQLKLCYRFMDSLAATHPDQVTKYDPMTDEPYLEGGVEINPLPEIKKELAAKGHEDWPLYCKGITEKKTYQIGSYSVELLPTPSYKTFIYRLYDKSIIAEDQGERHKRKVYIQAGIHAAEVLGQISSCLFSELLLSDNENSHKLLSYYDFWIVPCLEGYGGMHGYSLSALRVNPNRNYATPWWKLDEDIVNSGLVAGDHFSVSLSMCLVDNLYPDVAIDVHTLNNTVTQQSSQGAVGVYRCYPSEALEYGLEAASYVTALLTSKYPAYYTTKPGYEISSPARDGSRCSDYFVYKSVPTSATVECNNVIGHFSHTTNSSESLSVSAFWLKNCVYALCKYNLENCRARQQGIAMEAIHLN